MRRQRAAALGGGGGDLTAEGREWRKGALGRGLREGLGGPRPRQSRLQRDLGTGNDLDPRGGLGDQGEVKEARGLCRQVGIRVMGDAVEKAGSKP